MNSRAVVLKILLAFDKKPGPLDYAIEREFELVEIDSRDRRFIYEIVYGVVRRRLTLDYILEQYLDDPTVMENDRVKRILEIGAYQIMFMDRVPDHACVNESVSMAKNHKQSMHCGGLVNATLRAVIKNRKTLVLPDPQKDLVHRLAVEFSHPEWMVKRWLATLGLSKTKLLLSFNNEKPDTFLRRKFRGLSRPQFEAEVKDICDSASGYQNLFYRVRKQTQPDLMPLFNDGQCTVQASSSGWVVAMLDVQPGDFVVDLCSAPGGKSALIAELSGSNGLVTACEIRGNRMRQALETFKRLHITNAVPLLCDSIKLPFKGTFDKVLLDAPCSGSGVLHRHPEGRWIKQETDIARLSERQKQLLHAASAIVRKDGILVYSTCSIEPEENEQVVTSFLKDHPEFILESPPDTVLGKYVGPNKCLRITPYEHKLDGMFAARFKKTV